VTLAQCTLLRIKQDPSLLYDERAWLVVELPVFDIPILYEETFYPIPQHGVCGVVSPVDLAAYRKRTDLYGDSKAVFDPMQLVLFLDYENESDNPVEDKYRTLAHDLLRGLVDPALKPDREQRNRLNSIIDSPSHHPTREEKDLLWRFRFSLVDNRRALTKFLLAVDWTVESEVVQAAELLEQWRMRSPIEVTDALKLLGKNVAFQTNLVRDYAIDTLALAPDSELRLYLLQLVQALKYENLPMTDVSTNNRTGGNGTNIQSTSPPVSSLATFLINRAAGNIQLANYLYWYVDMSSRRHSAELRSCDYASPFDGAMWQVLEGRVRESELRCAIS
jgi:phosphatidylinositol 3-kinase